MSNRWFIALAIVAAAPAAAAAQFTTFIARPNPVRDSIKAAVVADQRVMTDSITQAKITDMKTWVDSAAGISRMSTIDTTTPPRVAMAKTTTAVSNGTVAPATASNLPFLIALGGTMMLIGLALLRRPQAVPRRTSR